MEDGRRIGATYIPNMAMLSLAVDWWGGTLILVYLSCILMLDATPSNSPECKGVREGAPVMHPPIAFSSHRCHDERQAHYYDCLM